MGHADERNRTCRAKEVRNIYDDHPYDLAKGGRDADGDGIPDSGFVDRNANGLPDHLDWGVHGRDPELARIQLGLFPDHKIILVERNAEFDLALARAVDDVVRLVFRDYIQGEPVLPTLRTVAVEKTALLNALTPPLPGTVGPPPLVEPRERQMTGV